MRSGQRTLQLMSLFKDRRTVWAVASLIAILFAIANLPWQLDDYDQAKQAFTSFEMVKEGHWFYQHTPHERVATKPPLAGWISVAFFTVTRSWEIAWRLPSVAAALVIALLLFRASKQAYGKVAAVLALSAFGLNLLSPRLATLVRTDMPLALTIFLIGLLIWEKIRCREQWRLPDQVCVFLLLTAAMLIKGPIVYAFLLPGVVVFSLRRGMSRPQPVRSDQGAPKTEAFSAWPGWWPWLGSLAIFLIWVAVGIRFKPGFYDEVVMREFVGRFGETIHRPQPLLFYLPHLLHKFAPWSVLIIAIAAVDLHSRDWRLRSGFRDMAPETFWLLCWSIGGLIVMSLIPSKRVDRIFPVIPPFCLLLASQIGSHMFCSSGGIGRRSRFRLSKEELAMIALALAIVFSGGYTCWKVIAGYRENRDALAIFGKNVRHEAETHHWRYEVISAKDEGLLLYLRKIHFMEPQRAVAEWNQGKLDALVASSEKAAMLIPNLQDAVVSESTQAQVRGYVLITR